jgi:hypothetical protein
MNAFIALPAVQRGALAVAALVAVALVVVFHSIVVGAVERAAHRRAETELAALRTVAGRPAQQAYVTTRRVWLMPASD